MSRVRQNSANIRFVRDSEKGISAERKYADSLQTLKEEGTNFLSKVFFQLCASRGLGGRRNAPKCVAPVLCWTRGVSTIQAQTRNFI